MRLRSAGVFAAVVLLALAAVPGSDAALNDTQCTAKYYLNTSHVFQTAFNGNDLPAFMNCTYLDIMGMEATYCKGCGDFPARVAAACAEANATNDNCSSVFSSYCSNIKAGVDESSLGKIVKLSKTGACQSDCRKHATCDKCGAGCTWSVLGCATTTFLTELQKTGLEEFKPGGFYGCTWESGKCFDYCPITEFNKDDNYNYSSTSKLVMLKAMNIGNFEFSAMQGWFDSRVGEVFAKEAFSEYSDEECADEDNACERGDNDNDDDDQGPQGGMTGMMNITTMTTPAGCSVNSTNTMFGALFNDTAPKKQPPAEAMTKDNAQASILSSMILYATQFSAGRMSENETSVVFGDGGDDDDDDGYAYDTDLVAACLDSVLEF